jgi:hypothetical protein
LELGSTKLVAAVYRWYAYLESTAVLIYSA